MEKDNITYNWSDKKILIAEDEMMNYLYLEEALRESEARIIWCQNGKEAVDKVTKKPNKYDLILMDVKMPIMDGLMATELIKKINKDIPIIIQTAFAMNSDKEKGFEAGCDDYLEKPIRQHILLSTLKKYL